MLPPWRVEVTLSHIIPIHNQLLARLEGNQRDLLKQHLQLVDLAQYHVLFEAGDEVEHVYFPNGGMLSLLVVMQDGHAIETATVGKEGVVGAMVGLGFRRSLVRAVVQLPGAMLKIPADEFRRAVEADEGLRDMCMTYNEVLLAQARILAACNALHPINQRFSRWLLQSADRIGGNTIGLTQELLSEMLGVRRTSVTEAAMLLQHDGLIEYSRGVITILDRRRLEASACECYQTLLDHSATLVPEPVND